MKNKKIIRLNESQLERAVLKTAKEHIEKERKTLNENIVNDFMTGCGGFMLDHAPQFFHWMTQQFESLKFADLKDPNMLELAKKNIGMVCFGIPAGIGGVIGGAIGTTKVKDYLDKTKDAYVAQGGGAATV